MNDRYFIIDVVVPAGSRAIEHNLAAYVRKYTDMILSREAMQRLAEQVGQQQDELVAANKRIKPVRVELDLPERDDLQTRWQHFYIGQVYVTFRKIAGELI